MQEQRKEYLMLAFVEQKGFSLINKYAMADIVVELVESKKEVVVEKVLEQVEAKKEVLEKKVDEVADKAEAAIEKAGDEIGKKAEAILDKLDDNPHIAKAIDVLDDIVGDELNNREISCSCFGWLVALRITRKTQKKPQATPEEILNIELPGQIPNVLAKPRRQSKPLRSLETDSAPQS